jgi:hypothetical protein
VHNNTAGQTYRYLLAGSFQSVVQINMTDIVDKTKVARSGTTGDAASHPGLRPGHRRLHEADHLSAIAVGVRPRTEPGDAEGFFLCRLFGGLAVRDSAP